MADAAASNGSNRDVRRSLFDVLARHSGRILLAFYIIWAVLAGLMAYSRFVTAENPPLAWPEIVIISIVSAALTAGVALPITIGLVEGTSLVLAEFRKRFYREEGRREGRAEGREEGRATGRMEGIEETQQAWESWLERRDAAERAGQPFTEPPPNGNGVSSNGQT